MSSDKSMVENEDYGKMVLSMLDNNQKSVDLSLAEFDRMYLIEDRITYRLDQNDEIHKEIFKKIEHLEERQRSDENLQLQALGGFRVASVLFTVLAALMGMLIGYFTGS